MCVMHDCILESLTNQLKRVDSRFITSGLPWSTNYYGRISCTGATIAVC